MSDCGKETRLSGGRYEWVLHSTIVAPPTVRVGYAFANTGHRFGDSTGSSLQHGCDIARRRRCVLVVPRTSRSVRIGSMISTRSGPPRSDPCRSQAAREGNVLLAAVVSEADEPVEEVVFGTAARWRSGTRCRRRRTGRRNGRRSNADHSGNSRERLGDLMPWVLVSREQSGSFNVRIR